jgi:hypothetical protein
MRRMRSSRSVLLVLAPDRAPVVTSLAPQLTVRTPVQAKRRS